MKKIILSVLLCWTINVQADQLESILEIEYSYDGEQHTAYLTDDFWLFQISEKADFNEIFKTTYSKHGKDTLVLFNQLIDRTILKEKSNLPIKPFELKSTSQYEIALKDMKNIKFRQSYKQSGYTNIIFTPLNLSDTTWVGNEFETINLGHDDVGCRIYVHRSTSNGKQTPLIKEIYENFPANGDHPSEEQLVKIHSIARELKRYKAVVTMACGC